MTIPCMSHNICGNDCTQVKEAHSYVCPNPATEAAKWAAAPGKYAKSHTVIDPRAGNAVGEGQCGIGDGMCDQAWVRNPH
jgi:succinate dehydrogenase/fumarate reductase-like Fe-S protein